jgi:hypothetical protein
MSKKLTIHIDLGTGAGSLKFGMGIGFSLAKYLADSYNINLVVGVQHGIMKDEIAPSLAISEGFTKVPFYKTLDSKIREAYPPDEGLEKAVDLFFNPILGELGYECQHEITTSEGYLDWNKTLCDVISKTLDNAKKTMQYWRKCIERGNMIVEDVNNRKVEVDLPEIVISAGHPASTLFHSPLRDKFSTKIIYTSNFLWPATIKSTMLMYNSHKELPRDVLESVNNAIDEMYLAARLYDKCVMPELSIPEHVRELTSLSGKEVKRAAYYSHPPKKVEKVLKIDPERPTVMVSTGKTGVGENLLEKLVPELNKNYNVILPPGSKLGIGNVIPKGYPALTDFFSKADLAIIRAGMGSVYENLISSTPLYLLSIPGDHAEIKRNEEILASENVARVGDLSRHSTKEIVNDIVETLEERLHLMKKEVKRLNRRIQDKYGDLDGFKQAARIIADELK